MTSSLSQLWCGAALNGPRIWLFQFAFICSVLTAILLSSKAVEPLWQQGPVSWKTIFPWAEGVGDGFRIIQLHYTQAQLLPGPTPGPGGSGPHSNGRPAVGQALQACVTWSPRFWVPPDSLQASGSALFPFQGSLFPS